MRKLFLIALLAGALRAAVIQGTVVENQTGHPVARANVVLEPVAGFSGPRKATRTNLSGFFSFTALPAGAYVLTASRTGFATIQYGQKQWKSAGTPIPVAENDSYTVSLRLPRFGAIVGTVLDENDVGLPDFPVLAYRNTRPPQVAGSARADERGIFRIFGLPPGSYLVRSAAKQYDDATYLPTFAKETLTLEQAFPFQVEMDRDVERADVRPIMGRLFTFTVGVTTVPPGLPVTITFASDMGRETVQAGSHTFGPMPAGTYEIYSQAPLDRRPGFQEDYRKVNVNRNDSIGVVTREAPDAQVSFAGGPGDIGAIQVLARRHDLAGPGPTEVLRLNDGRVHLGLGPWQLAIQPNPGFVVSGFSGPGYQRPDGRSDGWNDIVVGISPPAIKFTLSSNPGAVHGTVKAGGEPAIGAPVFLEPVDLDPARRLSDTFVTRTDLQGQYQFSGLTPGNYRLLASFEYSAPDPVAMSSARTTQVRIELAKDTQQDLDLYVIP